MSAATPRIANGLSSDRRLGVALLLLTLAVAALVAVVGQQAMKPTPTASTGNAQLGAQPATNDLIIGGTRYTGIPSSVSEPAAAPATNDLIVGGTTYTGIPSSVVEPEPATHDLTIGGTTYTGIPGIAPSKPGHQPHPRPHER